MRLRVSVAARRTIRLRVTYGGTNRSRLQPITNHRSPITGIRA